MQKNKILVIHGPNLQLLGAREPDVYGRVTILEINKAMESHAKKLGLSLFIVQSNHEGEIVDLLGKARKSCKAVIINPAAYTHTSVAIRDALKAIEIPAVEVHLSNIYSREEFRKISITAPACKGQICGFGKVSYLLALDAVAELLKSAATE